MDNIEHKEIKSILEALLLLAEKPVSVKQAREILEGLKPAEIKKLFEELAEEYLQRQSGIEIIEVAGGYQFRTRPELANWVKLFQKVKPLRLSRPAMETLAIVAYKQPVTRGQIEDVRGVDCGGVLKKLAEARLVKILGRKKVPGNPLIYGTSREFLEMFQLKGLAELPHIEEIESIEEFGEQLSFELETESAEVDQPAVKEPDATGPGGPPVQAATPPLTETNGAFRDERKTSESDCGEGPGVSPESGADDPEGPDHG
jgi:segregation and condensation protein B